MKQRAKLSAGQGWTAFLDGQRSRPESRNNRRDLTGLSGEVLRRAADSRIRTLPEAMNRSDCSRVQDALNETMYLLRRAKRLPGDEAGRKKMRAVVTWLCSQH